MPASQCSLKLVNVVGFTEALDMELRYMNKSIHTLKVCPSMVKTPMTKGMADKSNPKYVYL